MFDCSRHTFSRQYFAICLCPLNGFSKARSLYAAFLAIMLLSGCLDSIEKLQLNERQNIPSVNSQVNFSCENNVNMQSRCYVLLMGYGDHDKAVWDIEKNYMQMDSKANFVVIYDQDETKHIAEISDKFLADMRVLL